MQRTYHSNGDINSGILKCLHLTWLSGKSTPSPAYSTLSNQDKPSPATHLIHHNLQVPAKIVTISTSDRNHWNFTEDLMKFFVSELLPSSSNVDFNQPKHSLLSLTTQEKPLLLSSTRSTVKPSTTAKWKDLASTKNWFSIYEDTLATKSNLPLPRQTQNHEPTLLVA